MACYKREMNLPEKPQRKFLRLRGYDYSQAGGYYVTIVTQGRVYLFGEIQENEMVLNDAGKMVVKWWDELPGKFPSVTVDTYVVMPNHFHGIIFIHETVGAGLVPTQNFILPTSTGMTTRVAPTLGGIVGAFKSITTHEYVRGVKQSHWPRFIGKLWQRNYYEHIVRNEEDYERIFNYIESNPSNWAEDEENR
jgi:putative transposase